jgi:protein phosphatase
MPEFVVHVGARSAQGRRPNNEDRFVADADHHIYLVADGMGGQDFGEQASGMAVEIIPTVLQTRLGQETPDQAVTHALDSAHRAIIDAGQKQTTGRRMGTTAVLAVQMGDQVFVANLGDSRAYLIRGEEVRQLTVDHTVADALASNGTLTLEQARSSPWKNVLYKFLGCTEMTDGPDVIPFTPQHGDRLLLASDGLTNHVQPDDLARTAREFANPQAWADHLVELALERGSRDNVTCVAVLFGTVEARLPGPVS